MPSVQEQAGTGDHQLAQIWNYIHPGFCSSWDNLLVLSVILCFLGYIVYWL